MNFKAIVSAVALAALGTAAHAAVQNAAAINPELTVTLFNNKASYTLDLGLDANLLSTGLSTGYSFNLNTVDGAAFSSFLTKAAGGTALNWTLFAGNSQDNTAYTTAKKGEEALAGQAGGADGSNAALQVAVANFVAYSNNSTGTVAMNNSFQALAGSSIYYTLDGYNSAFGFSSEANTVGTTGVALFKFVDTTDADDFFYTPNQTANIAGLTTNSSGQYVLSIANATVTPSVPEPESYGLALVGLLLVGAVARRQAA
jgi:hypothetical protein